MAEYGNPWTDPLNTVRVDPLTDQRWIRWTVDETSGKSLHAWRCERFGRRYYRHHVDVAGFPVEVPDGAA